MVKQVFEIEHYWKVIVFYDVNYDLFDFIEEELFDIGITEYDLNILHDTMKSGKALAVTYSNLKEHTSIVLFNRHKTRQSYLNSIVHEAEHVKQAVLQEYNVEDEGEAPAYTIGYIVGQMYRVFYSLICKGRIA